MRLSDIISLGMDYLKVGIVICLIAAVGLYVWYALYFKKKGKKLKISGILIYGIFIVYMVVVLGATMLGRGSFYGGSKIQPLFYSYKEAWVNFTDAAWRNIILNIMMFVPFGVLLPCLNRKLEQFYVVYGIGFLTTLLIETAQLLLGRGIFEPDDLMGNTVGTMIGYGIYRLGRRIFTKKKDKGIVWLQIPLLVTVISFAGIFMTYHTKELGNLRESYIVKMENIQVDSDLAFGEEESFLMAYKTPKLSVSETREKTEEIFAKLGTQIDDTRTDIYDETAVYYSSGEGEFSNRYSIWYDYVGGTYQFTDFVTSFGEGDESIVEEKLTEADIRKELTGLGVFVPDNAGFSFDNGHYYFEARVLKEEGIYDGILQCTYSKQGYLERISNHMVALEEYKEFPVISEKEAYDRLCDGQFSMWRKDDSERMDIRVTGVETGYQIDTKGFYQPVYIFECLIDNREEEIYISAIK